MPACSKGRKGRFSFGHAFLDKIFYLLNPLHETRVSEIGLGQNHKFEMRPIVVDEVLEVHLDALAQLNVAGVRGIGAQQLIINLRNIPCDVVQHGPMKGITLFIRTETNPSP